MPVLAPDTGDLIGIVSYIDVLRAVRPSCIAHEASGGPMAEAGVSRATGMAVACAVPQGIPYQRKHRDVS